ncbi:hypothetical protein GCM10009790_34040 [Georgenia ruanii]
MLDPAHAPRAATGREPAAQVMLERILAEARAGGPAGAARGGGGAGGSAARGPVRRWLLVGAAAAVAVGLVVLPPWGAPEHAFATWTAVPEELPVARLQERLGELPCATGRSSESSLSTGEVVLAEERGDVTFIVTASPVGMAHCLVLDGQVTSSGWGSFVGAAELAPTEVGTVLAAGAGAGAGAYTAIYGRVGSDVVGVDVHPLGSPDDPHAPPPGVVPESVQATVDNGFYGAWWPGSGGGAFELTIHLADGTTLERVPAFE